MDQTSKQGWLILGGIWFITLFLNVLMQTISPLLPVLMADFELSHWTGGFLYSLPVLMIALFSFPLGILSDRIGIERAVGLGVTVAVLSSLLRPLSPSFSFLAFFTALFGLGFALCFPNLPKLVKEHFPPRLAGTATGAYTTAIPLGAGLGLSLTRPVFAATSSWRQVLIVWSLMALPVIVFWWAVALRNRKGQDRPDFRILNQQIRQKTCSGGSHFFSRYFRPIMILGLLFSLLNLTFYCTLGWLPTYLSEQGWNSTSAATVTSMISFIEIPAVFLIPVLSDRIGRRRLIIVLSFLLIAISFVFLAFQPALTWFLTPVLGVTFGGIFALFLALPVELFEREKVGRAAGAVISIGYSGALIGPPAAGYLRDLTGGFAPGFLIMAFAGIVAMGLSYLLLEARTSPSTIPEAGRP